MTTTAAAPTIARPALRLLSFLERERLVVAVVAAYATVALITVGARLNQDGWLALVSGRVIAHDGLPQHDTLTVWSSGTRWVDQQWLSQLAMYALHSAGGLHLVLLAHVSLITAALVAAVVVARADAEPVAVVLVALLAFASQAVVFFEVRTQAFGVAMFAAVLALLVLDARRPSRRVWAVLPLLALWANLHGSVVLGAGLVALRGLSLAPAAFRHSAARRSALIRGLALIAGAAVAVLASPYAAHLPAYYRQTALNPAFGKLLTEWMPTTLNAGTAWFYALLLVTVWAIGRSRMTGFERLALLATGISGLLAVRNTGWLALAALMILPPALDADVPRLRDGASRAARLGIVAVALVAVVAAALAMLLRPPLAESTYPAAAGRVVANAVARDPHARVFSELRYADWLLWTHPELSGRVAFDARVELLPTARLLDIARFSGQKTDHWRDAINGYDVVVVEPGGSDALLRGGGFRVAYRDARAAVLLRTSPTRAR